IIFFRNSPWLQYEQDFIASVSDMVMLAFEKWNRKWAEEELQTTLKELERLNKIKSDFISLVSHELRTPLTSILGYTSFMLKGIAGGLNSQQKEFMESIENNANHLLKLVNELIDMSRIEKGKFSIEKQECNIVEIIEKVINDMEPIINVKKVKIKKFYENNMIKINCDSQKIMQVINNLIDNAIKYCSKNIEINIEVKILKDIKKYQEEFNVKSGQYILISIRDNGMGIEKENLKKIFNMFTQLENIDTRKHSGVGLGLYIAQQIIKQHDGLIWAESEGIGRGTTFNILLPTN
ncbi:MAG: ATP-binding protein, partial [Candidatus Goldbacteria bacterium]|nr:ATP-binding protein [Candidatus Goldiibacteriota bacterium]